MTENNQEIQLWRTEMVPTIGENGLSVLCPLCGKDFFMECCHNLRDIMKAYYLAVNTLADISILEGSKGNMIRKAHHTLLEIEKL